MRDAGAPHGASNIGSGASNSLEKAGDDGQAPKAMWRPGIFPEGCGPLGLQPVAHRACPGEVLGPCPQRGRRWSYMNLAVPALPI